MKGPPTIASLLNSVFFHVLKRKLSSLQQKERVVTVHCCFGLAASQKTLGMIIKATCMTYNYSSIFFSVVKPGLVNFNKPRLRLGLSKKQKCRWPPSKLVQVVPTLSVPLRIVCCACRLACIVTQKWEQGERSRFTHSIMKPSRAVSE